MVSIRLVSRRITLAHRNLGDVLFRGWASLMAAIVLGLVALLIWQLYLGARPALAHFGFAFLTGVTWDPVAGEFGALPAIFGTIVSSLLALAIAGPLGLLAAIFLSETAPHWLERPVSFLVEMLASVPSVVYGLWAIYVLVPFVRDRVQAPLSSHLGFLPIFGGYPLGFGMMSAVMILAVMILPYTTAIARDVLKAVPQEQREGMLALGATRWETIWQVVVPCARSGIVGGLMLGLGRAIGETMAVTMVIGNRPEISASLFNPAYTLASLIANEFAEATYEMYSSVLIELGLVLLIITLILNAGARLLVWRVSKGTRSGR